MAAFGGKGEQCFEYVVAKNNGTKHLLYEPTAANNNRKSSGCGLHLLSVFHLGWQRNVC